MAILEIASGILVAPFFSVILMVLLLASFGKSFGIRRLYVKFLLRLFEVCVITVNFQLPSKLRHKENHKKKKVNVKEKKKLMCVVIEIFRGNTTIFKITFNSMCDYVDLVNSLSFLS